MKSWVFAKRMSFGGLRCQIVKSWVIWRFECRIKALLIPSVLKCRNWSKIVVKIEFGVFRWILGLNMDLYLQSNSSLTLGNILSFYARIKFLMDLVVSEGDFSVRMSFVKIFWYSSSILAFLVVGTNLVVTYRISGQVDLRFEFWQFI